MSERSEYIINRMKEAGYQLSEDQAAQFLGYYDMMIEKNQVMNLTRITEFKEAVDKHFVDSLMLSRVLDVSRVHKLIDIGTGGGFPGIPLKIMYPHMSVVMLDSVGKKIDFVKEVIEKLDLKDVCALHVRAEDMARDRKHREKYDVCVSRAVANMTVLTEYCMPFVRVGGFFVAYKGDDRPEELAAAEKAVKVLGGKPMEFERFSLFGMGRCLVKIRKDRKTPMQYPRKAGIPAKAPIT